MRVPEPRILWAISEKNEGLRRVALYKQDHQAKTGQAEPGFMTFEEKELRKSTLATLHQGRTNVAERVAVRGHWEKETAFEDCTKGVAEGMDLE